MNSQFPQNVFDRESRYVLQRLNRPRVRLESVAGPSGRSWRLSGKNKAALSQPLIEMMLAQSLLAVLPDGQIRPTAAGMRRIGVRCDDAAFRRQHAAIAEPASPRAPAVNRTESAVHWLSRKRDRAGKPLLSEVQTAAAEKIRVDYEIAQLGPRVTANWSNPMGVAAGQGSAAPPSDHAIAAKSRFFAAIDAIGPELSGIVIEICCLASGIEHAERRLSLPVRSGKAVLQMALTTLARHYGLIRSARMSRDRMDPKCWGTAGYRPELQSGFRR